MSVIQPMNENIIDGLFHVKMGTCMVRLWWILNLDEKLPIHVLLDYNITLKEHVNHICSLQGLITRCY